MIRVLAILFLFSSQAFAKDVWLSSNTATAETLGVLCRQGQRGVYHGTCVNTAATSGLTVFNSSFTSTGTFGLLNANAVGCYYYDVAAPKGLTYTKTGTADLTILYKCY